MAPHGAKGDRTARRNRQFPSAKSMSAGLFDTLPTNEIILIANSDSPAANSLFHEPKLQSAADMRQFQLMEEVFNDAGESLKDKIDAFAKFASRQAIAKFLVRYEIFKQILEVNGSIVECGVLHGAGLFTFAVAIDA